MEYNFLTEYWGHFKYRTVCLFSGMGTGGLGLLETFSQVAEVFKYLGMIAGGIVAMWSAFRYFQNQYKKHKQRDKQ